MGMEIKVEFHKKGNIMLISIYKDTAAGYGLCKDDNPLGNNELVIDVAKKTLEDYYHDSIAVYKDKPMSFEQWITSEYTMDDMEGLLEYIEDTEGSLDKVEVDESI